MDLIGQLVLHLKTTGFLSGSFFMIYEFLVFDFGIVI